MEKIIKETIGGILESMEIAFEKIGVENPADNIYNVNIESEEFSPLLIGFHGETIDALQYIAKIIIWKKAKLAEGESFTLNLDVDDYKARQEENALMLARRKVDEAISSGRDMELPPMKPFLRKKIHTYIAELENPDISTESIGQGDQRKIKIVYNG